VLRRALEKHIFLPRELMLTEFVTDFIEDFHGDWYLIKLKSYKYVRDRRIKNPVNEHLYN
jgi:hypothetical protein